MCNFRIVDIEKTTRKNLYNLYRQMDYPHFGLCAEIDITALYNYCSYYNLSIFKTMLFFTSKVANSIKEFRYRIRNEQVIEYEVVHPSYTLLVKDDAFNFCTVKYTDDFKLFYENVLYQSNALKGNINIDHEEDRDDLLYITCVPWISFTQIFHPIHFNPVDSIPRIAWGKYITDNSQIKLPLAVQANHSLMDGLHVGLYYNKLQECLNNFKKYIETI